MDTATQQNAALVEEMAAATASLKAQANDLVDSVSIFLVNGKHAIT
jgi:methyl-accepting chemotaxis protein